MKEKLPREYTYVFLRATDPGEQRVFWCHLCRSRILQYTGQVAMVTPANGPDSGELMKTPFKIDCHGNNPQYGDCPMSYIFEGFVAPPVKSWLKIEVNA